MDTEEDAMLQEHRQLMYNLGRRHGIEITLKIWEAKIKDFEKSNFDSRQQSFQIRSLWDQVKHCLFSDTP